MVLPALSKVNSRPPTRSWDLQSRICVHNCLDMSHFSSMIYMYVVLCLKEKKGKEQDNGMALIISIKINGRF